MFVLALSLVAGESAMCEQKKIALNDAIDMALAKNEDIFVSRESAASARSALSGARGVYDPVLELNSNWQRLHEPLGFGTGATFADDQTQTSKSFGAGAAISQYLPTGGSITVQANGSRVTSTGQYDLLSPLYQTDLGIELRQPLLRGFSADRSRLSIRLAEAAHRRSNAELEVEVTRIVANVQDAYWNLSAARAEIEVREESIRLAQEQLDQTQDRVSSGSAPHTELAQPRAELERRRGDLLASVEAASRAETALKTLILSDSDEEMWLDTLTIESDRDTVIVASREDAMQRALKVRPELEAARATLDDRKATKAYADNSRWPSLDAVVSYDRFGISGNVNPATNGGSGTPVTIDKLYDGNWSRAWDQVSSNDFNNVQVGLVLSYPIGNRGANASSAVAKHAQRQAEAELQRERKTVRAEVLNALAALETTEQRIEAAKAEREAAEVQLSAEQDRFKVGLTTNFLVLTRQNDLARAQLDEISARVDYHAAATEFARVTGSLLQQYNIDLQQSSE